MSRRAVRIVGLFVRFKDHEARRTLLQIRDFLPEHWRGVEGDCLAPYLIDGDAVMIDFEREPVDGDLVLVEMIYRRSGMIGGYGATVTREAVKQLRIVDGERHLCAAEGSVHADGHTILGTVIAWHRPGWWRRPAVRKMQYMDTLHQGRS